MQAKSLAPCLSDDKIYKHTLVQSLMRSLIKMIDLTAQLYAAALVMSLWQIMCYFDSFDLNNSSSVITYQGA